MSASPTTSATSLLGESDSALASLAALKASTLESLVRPLESLAVSAASSRGPDDESPCTAAPPLLRPSKDGTHALTVARAIDQTLRASIVGICISSTDEGQIVDRQVGAGRRSCHTELDVGQRATVDWCQTTISRGGTC